MLRGNFHPSLVCELEYTQQQKNAGELMIATLPREQQQLQEQVASLDNGLNLKNTGLQNHCEELEARNEHLDHKLKNSVTSKQQLRSRISILEEQLSTVTRQAAISDSENAKAKRHLPILEEQLANQRTNEVQYRQLKNDYKILQVERQKILAELQISNDKQQATSLLLRNNETKLQRLNSAYQEQLQENTLLKQKNEGGGGGKLSCSRVGSDPPP